MAHNSSLAKTLFYDLVQQSCQPASLSSVDTDNCYNRIANDVASLLYQAFGVPQEAIGSMLRTIQEMKFFLHTAYGDLNKGAKLQIKIKTQGLCQCNITALAGWR